MSRFHYDYSDDYDYRERPVELRRTRSSRSGNYQESRSREREERLMISRPRIQLSPERDPYAPSTPPLIYRPSSSDGRRIEEPARREPVRRRTRSVERVQEFRVGNNALVNLETEADACMDSLRELENLCKEKFLAAADHSSGATFGDIAKRAEDQRFKLKVWVNEIQLHDAARAKGSDVITIVSNNFKSIEETAHETTRLCRQARSSDLAQNWSHYDGGYGDDDEPLGLRIEDNLSSNDSVIQSLALLTESVKSALEFRNKETSASARKSRTSAQEVGRLKLESELALAGVAGLSIQSTASRQDLIEDNVIQDIVDYFGSNDRVRRHPIPPNRTGSMALQEAKVRYGGQDSVHILRDRLAEKEKRRIYEPRILEIRSEARPVYAKVHRDHLDIETLNYYNLPWQYDSMDSNYIIILEELDHRDTEALFEHTRSLRTIRRTSRSRSRSREGDGQFLYVRRRPSRTPERRKEIRERPRRSSDYGEVRISRLELD